MRWIMLALLCSCTPDGTGRSGTDSESDSDSDTPEDGWRSALYPQDWTPSFTDDQGRFLHDVSYAGYRYGEAWPTVDGPLFDVQAYGAEPSADVDNTAAFQAAIDAASAEGGVVWVPEGTYRVDGLLTLKASGVVIRGEGASRSRLAFTRVAGMTDRAHLTIGARLSHGPDHVLLEDGTSRSVEIRVADPGDLAVGMDVAVGWVITDDFIADHQMSDTWKSFNGTWRPIFRRQIVAIDGDRVRLDVPLRYDAAVRDTASLRVETGYVREVGVEDIGVSTKAPWFEAWDQDRSHAIDLIGVTDGWVSGLGSFDHGLVDDPDRGERHLQSGGIRIAESKRVTVADSSLGLAQNRGGGGNGYLFEITRSNEILTRDSIAYGGRHNFIQNWDFGTTGCVWLRTTSEDGFAALGASSGFGTVGLSEFHHSLAMANLIDDSVVHDGWAAVNRRNYSSGAGHSATESVFWNLRGDGEIRSFQAGMGYVIGTDGLTIRANMDDLDPFRWSEGSAPGDWVEGVDQGAELRPQSLYEDMRARRLQ